MPTSRALLAVALLLLAGCAPKNGSTDAADGRVSEFGRYEGYSTPIFSEWVTESHYVTMRDGVKLAVDISRPARNGAAVDTALPVLWTHSRYHRKIPPAAAVAASRDLTNLRPGGHPAVTANPDSIPPETSYIDANPTLQGLLKHGYVIVTVGVRGSDVSYGRYQGLFSPAETQDAYDVMDWMTKQAWCDGNIGMWGGSYLGITQYMAASTKHPALKAIFPNVAAFGMYDVIYNGGIYRQNMIQHWGILTRFMDVAVTATPVDEDELGAMAKAAVAQHADNWDVIDEYRKARFRDHDTPSFAYNRHEPAAMLDKINQSGVAAYHWGGWYDIFAMDEMLWLVNYTGPDRVTMGAWSHAATTDTTMAREQGRLAAAEQHRWFDRWLKDIKNGVDSEPPVRYALMNDPGSWTWKSAPTWPVPGVTSVAYHFAAGPSGSVKSVNDGLLATAAPADSGSDTYRVDLTTTTGNASRWDNAVGQGPMVYPDMTPNDAKSLTYTTAPLIADVNVVGHPVVTLYVSSNQPDGDFYALLEEVDKTGHSRYISEGMLRASVRETSQAPWNNLGLPYQRAAKEDVKPLQGGEVVKLEFDLQPTATVFNAGHRIRVTIMGADTDNTESPPVRGRPTIKLYRGGARASLIQLPILE
jgi:putative CocE/NonD family hydrolase